MKSKQDVLIYNSTLVKCNNAPIVRTIRFSRCLTKHNASLETAKVISSCNKKKKIPTIKSLQYEVFPGGQPSRYYPRPTGFNFGDRTSPSFFSCGVIVDMRRS